MAFNATEFLAALDSIEQAKGVSKETVIEALKEAMVKGFRKYLGGDDALVKVNVDPEHGVLEMYQIKMVVKDVQDDFLEISVEDAKEIDKKYKVGDEFLIPASVEVIKKAVSNIFKQKFAEAERGVLYDQFKDKINTMITGSVEKYDERGCSVNIGRTSVYLPRKEMIGDEKFAVGDNIKLYVSDVASGTKGAHIVVSRANEGFLRCLMSEEIHEIYDGTITIKSIAREAGERSKVAVYTPDANVDPAGACIGPNGSRIQKIVSQLGNAGQKEKIDIIAFTENTGLFIMEALKPARVVGINFNEEEKTATVVVKDDSLSLAIGRKGVNVRLAVKLTGYNIDIKTETDAQEEGFPFKTFEELQAIDVEARAKKISEAQREAFLNNQNAIRDVLPGLPEGYVAPMARIYNEEDKNNDLVEALNEVADKEENSYQPAEKKVSTEEVKKPVTEEKETKTEPVDVTTSKEEKTSVKTTTTLEDLEKSLESSKKKETSTKRYTKFKKKEEEKEETVSPIKSNDPSTYMSIYTEEELKAMEEEDKEREENTSDDDIDYDDYDDYYDEK